MQSLDGISPQGNAHNIREVQEMEKKKGMLVEDESFVPGTDKDTGETVIKPKTTEGKADESITPTDGREEA